MKWLMLGIAVTVAGCTTPNPKSCADGTCTDPAYPFCDVNGTLGGVPNECIAPVCESETFAECRGDTEVRCNATGDGYEVTRCERGCDPTVGCLSCEPNQTVCANGAVVRCDAEGGATVVEDCPLGCYENEPRCREVAPSNGLGMYLDMVSTPPDLDLRGGGTIDTTAGTITTAQDVVLDIPTFLVPAPQGGAPIRVFVANDVVLGDVSAKSDGPYEGPALAILARGEILVEGTVTVESGDVLRPGCTGSSGLKQVSGQVEKMSGSGGGAHATDGAPGGSVSGNPPVMGGQGGRASGSDTLVPLRGGCAAGGSLATEDSIPDGARGGGALQLTSRRLVQIGGTIAVNGSDGDVLLGGVRSGGGGGGGVLIEAPRVDLVGTAAVLARGGTGSGCPANPNRPSRSCGTPGAGARQGSEAQAGGDIHYPLPRGGISGGGGGGGLGRIRVNTKDGMYATTNLVVLEGAVTAGTLGTR
jgi:adhesin HecA-like repeat protein